MKYYDFTFMLKKGKKIIFLSTLKNKFFEEIKKKFSVFFLFYLVPFIKYL